jgi:shikimate dehydrogenase
MKKAFVIGHPIAHSRSPLIHNYWLKKYGLEGEYHKIDVAPDQLKTFVQSMREQGFVGGNVTIPHKEMLISLCDELTPRAKRLKAVNTLWFENDKLYGDSTDGYGFIAHLDHMSPDWHLTTRHVVVMGAGGAARGILDALLEKNMTQITLINRDLSRAQMLLTDFKMHSPHPVKWNIAGYEALNKTLQNVDLLINTTSLGMKGQPHLTIDLEPLPPHAIVYDIVYIPLETPLLKAAQSRGLKTVDGLGMLLYQAVPGFERWFKKRPDVTPDLIAYLEEDVRAHS